MFFPCSLCDEGTSDRCQQNRPVDMLVAHAVLVQQYDNMHAC